MSCRRQSENKLYENFRTESECTEFDLTLFYLFDKAFYVFLLFYLMRHATVSRNSLYFLFLIQHLIYVKVFLYIVQKLLGVVFLLFYLLVFLNEKR